MKETMDEILDEIKDQEIALIDKGLRAGFLLVGTDQFVILMRIYKRELARGDGNHDLDGSLQLSGMWIVVDSSSKDRLEVMPESSFRTDSILRNKGEI